METKLPYTQQLEDIEQTPDVIVIDDTNVLQPDDSYITDTAVTDNLAQALSYTSLIVLAKDWGPCSKWDEDFWDAFKAYIEQESPSGEEIMKILAYDRRDKVERLFYKLSEREQNHYSIRWENDYSKGERALPALKTGKEGLRISYKQLERLGMKVPRDTCFTIKLLSNNEFAVKFYPADNS